MAAPRLGPELFLIAYLRKSLDVSLVASDNLGQQGGPESSQIKRQSRQVGHTTAALLSFTSRRP